MNILDNNFELPEDVDAEYVTSQAMSALWDLCLEPMQDKLSEDDRSLISIIGVTLKLVAHKAKCYEEIQKGNLPPSEDDFSRN
jgi:hypothetical protein